MSLCPGVVWIRGQWSNNSKHAEYEYIHPPVSVPERVLQAWKDVYSFVILVVIPRTALRLEESVRSAGPVSTMLRPTPISGTRLKVLETSAPSPRHTRSSRINGDWQQQQQHSHRWHGGAQDGGAHARSPRPLVGTPNSAGAVPGGPREDQEWFGAGGRSPVRRSSSSGPFTRSSSGRCRKKGSKGWAGGGGGGWGRRSNHRSPGAGLGCNGSDGGGGRRRRAASGGSGSTFGVLGAPWGGRGHTLVAPYADSHDGEDGGGIYPPGSPFSMASSAGSGLHLSLAGSVSTVPRNDSICASPDGSSRMSVNGRSGPDAGKGMRGRRSKILRGLGMMGGPRSGDGGSAEEFGGGVPPSSPRETIGARARAVLGGRPRRQNEGERRHGSS